MNKTTDNNKWNVSSIAPYAVYAGRERIADCREANCVCYTERDTDNANLIASLPEIIAQRDAAVAALRKIADLGEQYAAMVARAAIAAATSTGSGQAESEGQQQ